ncbi:DUF4240 domain-containing protein [Nonomuraea dietziae]|uniref:DUF4240 domain-containing protein n=1 Tax=Nonomuraea dietziae TaxID=65515 RepID=UPI003428E6BE
MDIDGFWDLIERSEYETDTKRGRMAWLEEHLFGLSLEEIVDFDVFWTIATNRACSWDMYALYRPMLGSYSSDGFEYFVNWLVSLGREAFETVADCPDGAVELPQVSHVLELQRSALNGSRRRREVWTEEEYPEFESLGYVAQDPYKGCRRERDQPGTGRRGQRGGRPVPLALVSRGAGRRGMGLRGPGGDGPTVSPNGPLVRHGMRVNNRQILEGLLR